MNEETLKTDKKLVTEFEVKEVRRFIVKIKGVPSFMIFRCDRPSYKIDRYGRREYNELTMELHDPIVPSAAQCVEEMIIQKKQWNINIILLGPVCEEIEEWEIKDAKPILVSYGSLDWRTDKYDIRRDATVFIRFSLKSKNVRLLY